MEEIYTNRKVSNSLCTIKVEPNFDLEEPEIEDVFIKEEVSLDPLKNEKQEDMTNILLKPEVSNKIRFFKVESNFELENEEPGTEEIFVKEEMCLDPLRAEELEDTTQTLLKSEVSNSRYIIKIEPVSNLEVEEPEIDDVFVKEEVSLDPLNNDKLEDMTNLLQNPEGETGEKYLHRNNNAQKHQLINAGYKLFTCDICKKMYIYKYDLSVHMRVHSGYKPFSCDVCKKSFYCKKKLSFHMKIHSGDKPYSCDVCKKTFIQKCNLTRHMKIHLKDKPNFGNTGLKSMF